MAKTSYFRSDDYIGLEIGRLRFYYGYETARCSRHRKERSDECLACGDGPMYFVVVERKTDKEVFSISGDRLAKMADIDDLPGMLALGMALYFGANKK